MKIVVLKQGVHENQPEKNKIVTIEPVTSTTVYIEGKNKYIVDPGHKVFADEIISELAKQGVKPEEIDYVINTHVHLDHTMNNVLFKNAKIVTGYGDVIIIWSQIKPSVDIHLDKKLPFDELKLILTPGHLKDHVSVIAESDGKTYVIAGDAIQEEEIKSKGFTDKDQIESAKKILDIADIIIPGHGKIIQGKDLEELKKAVNKLEV